MSEARVAHRRGSFPSKETTGICGVISRRKTPCNAESKNLLVGLATDLAWLNMSIHRKYE